MNLLIQGARIMDPTSGLDAVMDLALAAGRVLAVGAIPAGFIPERVLDARGCIACPGLVDLAARLREPGQEHEGMLATEMAAAVAGGVSSLVCTPDTDPVLDEPGLVQMLSYRTQRLRQTRVYPLGALTRGLRGETLTEMLQLSEAGCVGFSHADAPLSDTLVLQRAMQYAATFGYTLWLRPQDAYLGRGVAASGALATRMGLSGVPVAAETIAVHTIVELMRAIPASAPGGAAARVHLCRLSSAQGVALVRAAKQAGLPLSCDVSINSLHLIDHDIGYFDSRARLNPPLRQQGDRQALSAGLADGTIDALVSDHNPVAADAKTLPFAHAEPGATGLELLLSLALKWGEHSGAGLMRALAVLTQGPAAVLCAAPAVAGVTPHLGRLSPGTIADICVFDPGQTWIVKPERLRSQGKSTPFAGYELPARVRWTLVAGEVAYEAVA